MKKFTDDSFLDVHPPNEGIMTLGFPLGSSTFVNTFLLSKLQAIDSAIALAATVSDGHMAQNSHRITASDCRVTHLISLIPPASVARMWTDFDARQSRRFESISGVPNSAAARRQMRLPRALA